MRFQPQKARWSLLGVLAGALLLLSAVRDGAVEPAKADPKGGGFQFIDSEATDAENKADAAKKEQDRALTERDARKKKLDEAKHSGIDKPVPPQEVQRLQKDYDEATRVLTEKTLAATEARNRANRLRSEAKAVNPPASTPGSVPAATRPTPNPIGRINPELGPTFRHVQKIDKILQTAKGLPAPSLVDPRYRAEPIEVQLRKLQGMYEPAARDKTASIAIYPKPEPRVTTPDPKIPTPGPGKPVLDIVGTWTGHGAVNVAGPWNFGSDGTFSVPGWSGTWRQSGNRVVATVIYDSPGLAFTATYEITMQGDDEATVEYRCSVRRGTVDWTHGSFKLRRQ